MRLLHLKAAMNSIPPKVPPRAHNLWVKAEPAQVFISRLFHQILKIHTAAINPRRCACLEPISFKAQLHQCFCQPRRWRLARPVIALLWVPLQLKAHKRRTKTELPFPKHSLW